MRTENYHGSFYIEHKIRVPNFVMNYEHVHNYCEIYYLKRGLCTYTVAGKKYHLSPGDMFIVKPGDPHSTCYEGMDECERLVVACKSEHLPEGFLDKYPDIVHTVSTSGKVVLGDSVQKDLDSLFEEMLSENNVPDDYSYDMVRLLIMKLLMKIQRHGIFVYENIQSANDMSESIEKAIKYIALNYQMPLTLDEVSARFNLCPSYFSKKFKQDTGMTFIEYVNYIRLRQAAQMLITTDDTVTKIAVNCGFNSSNYFKDCFRKTFGYSPRAFRNIPR